MKLEEAIKKLKSYENKLVYEINEEDKEAVKTVLEELERYKRLAEVNLKDSEEFKNNMCEHRCILKSELQEIQENSIPKQKIKDKIEEYKNLIDDISESEQYSHEIPLYKHDIQVLQELLEDK